MFVKDVLYYVAKGEDWDVISREFHPTRRLSMYAGSSATRHFARKRNGWAKLCGSDQANSAIGRLVR